VMTALHSELDCTPLGFKQLLCMVILFA